MYRISFYIILLSVFIAPNYASAQVFVRNLSLGSVGEDVRILQQLLNEDESTRLANYGAGSPGNETTYYGSLTQNAVTRFQNLYADEILVPLGLTSGTGFFGPSTIQTINERTVLENTLEPVMEDTEREPQPQPPNEPPNDTSENGSTEPLSEYENQEYEDWLAGIAGLATQPFGGRISYIQYNCLCSLSVNIFIANTTGRTQPVSFMFYYGAQLMEVMADFLGIEELDPSNVIDIGLPIPRLYSFYGLYEGPQVLGNYLPGEFQCWAFVGPPTWCMVQGEAQGAIIQMGTSLF